MFGVCSLLSSGLQGILPVESCSIPSGLQEDIENADQDIRTKETRLLFHEKKWQKRWLPLIMTHIEQFNKDFIEDAGKRFTKSLEVNPIYLSTLPPDTGPFKFRDPFSISLLPSTFV